MLNIVFLLHVHTANNLNAVEFCVKRKVLSLYDGWTNIHDTTFKHWLLYK